MASSADGMDPRNAYSVPYLKRVAPEPKRSTLPTISWPNINGKVQVGAFPQSHQVLYDKHHRQKPSLKFLEVQEPEREDPPVPGVPFRWVKIVEEPWPSSVPSPLS